MFKELTDLIAKTDPQGGGKYPTLALFREAIRHLDEQESIEWLKKVFCIAFACWKQANTAYRNFMVLVIIAHRQQFIDFYRNETVMGQLLYPVIHAETLLLFMILWHQYETEGKVPVRHLAFCVSLIFNIPLSLRVLCNKASARKTLPVADLLDIYARARIGAKG